MTAAAGSAGERGLRSEKARTAHARLHIGRGPLEKPGSRWQHRTKFRALKDDLSALCAAQVLRQPLAATSLASTLLLGPQSLP